MADKKISALTAATTPLAGTEVLPIVQGGATVKVAVSNLTAGRAVSALSLNVSGDVVVDTTTLVVNSTNNNVGIGTATPTVASGIGLVLNGGAGQTRLAFKNSTTGDAASDGVQLALVATGFIYQNRETGGSHNFEIDGSEYFKVESTGNATLNNGNLVIGTAGKGIDFSADPSAAGMTSELLDDYEEGTWTPTIAGSTTAGTGTYSTQAASYTKVGNRLLFSAYITWSAHTGTGNMRIAGLPFTVTNNDNNYSSVSIYLDSATAFTAGNVLQARNILNSTQLIPTQYLTGGGAPAQVTLPTSGGIVISGQYYI